jgi:hypothetical protein
LFGSSADGQRFELFRKNILPPIGEYCLLYCCLEEFGLRSAEGEEELGKAK